ncbi:hypothetical protein [Streptomyces sp. NBC_00829]|uniref:hypothetical protein n=1 Tax=Streptomyces sp. NBC_00829 TaxID=2903679 RepID=UPI00386FCCF9|nr:hypothetical protein OG293_07385 [Streptomyces sp. NBC_00829]
MCIRIAVAEDLPEIAVWDPDEVSILVARGVQVHVVIRELHAILTIDLSAPAAPGGALLCFCGTRLELPQELAPLAADVAEAG